MLRDLSFRYPDSDEFVLRGISLDIRENHTTAFVGSSGAGKSTLLDLVLGLPQAHRGRDRRRGPAIDDDLAGWYSGLGVVPQDVFLLNDTLTTNIAFGVDRGDSTPTVSPRWSRWLSCDLVADLPRGARHRRRRTRRPLLGRSAPADGTRPRLYRQPRVLVLDEATSALDNVTEHEITETLGALQGTLTILIVAHRLRP